MSYDSPDNEVQISEMEEDFIEALFEAICSKEIEAEILLTPVK